MRSAIRFNIQRYKCACFIVLSALSFSPCAAQQEKSISLRFASFPNSNDTEPLELLIADSKVLEIEAPSNEISKPYMVNALGTWVIGKRVTGDDGKPKFEVYGKTKALASSKQLLLLVRKGPTNADGFEIIALDSRKAQFGGEKFLFLNAAKVGIAGVIGEEKIALKPGAHSIIKPKANRGARKNLCHVSFAYRRGEEWKVFSSTMWPVHKKARSLVFFYQDPKTLRLRLHAIRDFIP